MRENKDINFIKTQLATLRLNKIMSQKELSALAGVNLRMIQDYEQRAKDINKASAITVYKLASALGCKMEDIIEK